MSAGEDNTGAAEKECTASAHHQHKTNRANATVGGMTQVTWLCSHFGQFA